MLPRICVVIMALIVMALIVTFPVHASAACCACSGGACEMVQPAAAPAHPVLGVVRAVVSAPLPAIGRVLSLPVRAAAHVCEGIRERHAARVARRQARRGR